MDKVTFVSTQLQAFMDDLQAKVDGLADEYGFSWMLPIVSTAMIMSYKAGLERGWTRGEEEQDE